MVPAGMVSAPRGDQSARRWRSPGSGGANRLGFSAAARRDVRADGGSLTGAVESEEAEDFAGSDVQMEIVYGSEFAVLLGEAAD